MKNIQSFLYLMCNSHFLKWNIKWIKYEPLKYEILLRIKMISITRTQKKTNDLTIWTNYCFSFHVEQQQSQPIGTSQGSSNSNDSQQTSASSSSLPTSHRKSFAIYSVHSLNLSVFFIRKSGVIFFLFQLHCSGYKELIRTLV